MAAAPSASRAPDSRPSPPAPSPPPASVVPPATRTCLRAPQGTFAWCPVCDGRLEPEHAHYRCADCGWRDSCCD